MALCLALPPCCQEPSCWLPLTPSLQRRGAGLRPPWLHKCCAVHHPACPACPRGFVRSPGPLTGTACCPTRASAGRRQALLTLCALAAARLSQGGRRASSGSSGASRASSRLRQMRLNMGANLREAQNTQQVSQSARTALTKYYTFIFSWFWRLQSPRSKYQLIWFLVRALLARP